VTDRDALLAAVRAAPADDAPRLVFADWLDEHGEADLAAFVRVQCELASLPPAPTPLECRAVLRPGRRAVDQVYRAVVPVVDGPPLAVGQVVRLVPADDDGRPVPPLVLTDVSESPWAAIWPPPPYEVEVSGVPAELGEAADRRAELERKERDLYLCLHVPPVRVGGAWYEVGLPAHDQPATLRRGFVDELAVPAAGFLHDADDLLSAHPIRVLRLETMPAVERAEGAEPGTVDASLLGRDFWVTTPADLPEHELVLRLFAAEWPGLEVHLPAAGWDAA
jgi:uncharacterized protein (TIGR02996 family)